MPLSQATLKKLKNIIGFENVITDSEDLYVYSFEGPLGMIRAPTPSAVVLPKSQEEATELAKLAKGKGINVIWRDKAQSAMVARIPYIVIDTVASQDAENIKQSLEREKATLYKRSHNAIPRFSARAPATWFTDFISTRSIYRCRECTQSTGTACSGYCMVGPYFKSGEIFSSKGRLMLSRGLLNGDLEPTKRLIDSIYTCALCGQCYDQCMLGDLELNRAIMFARYEIAKKGLAPQLFKDMSATILERDTPVRMPLRTRNRTWWLDKLDKKLETKEAKVLYWTGCIAAYRFPNIAIAAFNLLGKADLNFTTLGEEEGCCGLPLFDAGLWKEAEIVAVKTMKKIAGTGAKILVTGCAGCYYTFKRLYREILGLQLPVKVLHLSQFIQPLVKKGGLKFKDSGMKVTYHDPCSLGRHCAVYDAPREAIRAVPNTKFVETYLNKNHATCCGGGGNLWAFNRTLAMKIARKKLVEEVLPLKVEAILTACPQCYMNIKYSAKLNKINIKVVDLAEFMDKASK